MEVSPPTGRPQIQARIDEVEGQLQRKAAATEAETPVHERELFLAGDKIRQASQDLFGTPNPQFDDRFISKLTEGAATMAGFVGITLLTGIGGGAAAGSALNASGMYRRAQNFHRIAPHPL